MNSVHVPRGIVHTATGPCACEDYFYNFDLDVPVVVANALVEGLMSPALVELACLPRGDRSAICALGGQLVVLVFRGPALLGAGVPAEKRDDMSLLTVYRLAGTSG